MSLPTLTSMTLNGQHHENVEIRLSYYHTNRRPALIVTINGQKHTATTNDPLYIGPTPHHMHVYNFGELSGLPSELIRLGYLKPVDPNNSNAVLNARLSMYELTDNALSMHNENIHVMAHF